MSEQQSETFEGYAILELMGHRRLGGYLRTQEIAGAAFIRIDLPATGEDDGATQFYAPSAVYCITPCAEEIARKIAADAPRPVTRWELRAIEARAESPIERNERELRAAGYDPEYDPMDADDDDDEDC